MGGRGLTEKEKGGGGGGGRQQKTPVAVTRTPA